MSRTPWYRWYPGDYLADTYSLSWDADLLYRRILDALWTNPTLPSSPRDLSKILRTDPRKISRILPEVLPHLRETSGRLDHPKMTAQRAESEHLRATRAIAGQKGGLAKAKAKGSLRARGPDPDPDPDPEKDKDPPPANAGPPPPAVVRTNGTKFALPDWIPTESWTGYEDMRRKIRKPLTDRARTLAVGKLEKLFRDGHMPGAVLDQSVLHSWQGLFPPKTEVNRNDKPDNSIVAQLERKAGLR